MNPVFKILVRTLSAYLHREFNCLFLSETRALTPLFGNLAGAHGIGKISSVLTKFGKYDIVFIMTFPLLD